MKSSDLRHTPLTRELFPKTHHVLEQGVADQVAPGFVAGLWTKKEPEIYRSIAVGVRRWRPSAQPLFHDTVFDLASVTKIYATAPLIASFVERGKLQWCTRVSEVLKGYAFKEIRVKHLLSHTAGFVAWRPLWEDLRRHFAPKPVYEVKVEDRQAAMKKIVLGIAPEVPVETRALYSDISFLLLGFILEELTGKPLDQAIQDELWHPLGMERSAFRRVTTKAGLASDLSSEIAATEDSEWRGGILQGQVHDDNAWAMGGFAGHAGAFGDARDLLFFAKRLMTGYFPLRIRDEMWTRADWPAGCERTMGWDTPSDQNSTLGSLMSRNSVGHWGFTGTSLWIDRDREIAVTLLSNRVHPSRENNLIKLLRPRFHDALIEDLTLQA